MTKCTILFGALVAAAAVWAAPALALAPPAGGLSQLASPDNCTSQGGVVCGRTTGKGLDEAFGVAVSSDGKHVYVASATSDAVAAFARNAQTGALAQLGAPSDCISQGGIVCGTTSGKGLDGAIGVVVTPDGKNVYVTGRDGDAIAAFARNALTGALAQLPSPKDCTSQGGAVCGTTTGKGLLSTGFPAVSPDGKHVYVPGFGSDAIAAFSRNAQNGALTQLAAPNDCISQGGSVCGTTTGKGLDVAFSAAVSPDGKHVYVASGTSDAVAAFSRNAQTGALTQLAAPNNCISEGGSVCGTTTGKGLSGANDVTVSPDGKNVYVASFGSDAVAVFSRNAQTGALTQLAAPNNCISQGGSVCGTTTGKGLVAAAGVTVDPAGRNIYVSSSGSNAVVAFSRNAQNGALTQLAAPYDCTSQGGSVCGTTTGKGLDDAYTVATAPDGKHVYVGADVSDAVAAFVREVAPVCTSTAKTVRPETPTAVAVACSDANGDPLTRTIVQGPGHGTLGGISAGSVTYRPIRTFAGADTFAFHATAGGETSSTATAQLNVQPDVTDVDLEILTRGIRVSRRGVAKVKLECDSPDGDRCEKGLAQIVTAKRVTVSRRRRVTLAKRSFSIAAGKRKTIKLKLSKRKRRLVRRLRKVKVKIKVTGRDDGGNKALDKETVKLKAPKRRRRS